MTFTKLILLDEDYDVVEEHWREDFQVTPRLLGTPRCIDPDRAFEVDKYVLLGFNDGVAVYVPA